MTNKNSREREEGDEIQYGYITNPFRGKMPGWHSQSMSLAKASDYVELGTGEDFTCLVSAPYSEGCALSDYIAMSTDKFEGDPDETMGTLPLKDVLCDIVFYAWPGCTKEECESQICQYLPKLRERTLKEAVSEAMGDYEAFWHEEKSLPVEFFLHQVYDMDTEDDDAIVKFVSSWGIPTSPLRVADVNPAEYYEAQGTANPYGANFEVYPVETTFGNLLRANEAGIEETDRLRALLLEKMGVWEPEDPGKVDPEDEGKPCWTPCGPVVAISLSEAKASLDLIKHCVGWYQGILEHEGVLEYEKETDGDTQGEEMPWSFSAESKFILRLLNTTPGRAPVIEQNFKNSPKDYAAPGLDNNGSDYDSCSFTKAVLRQLAETLANESVPWKRCEHEGCGKYFKYQQGKSLPSRTPRSKTKYCSRKCADNKAHKNKRKRDREA